MLSLLYLLLGITTTVVGVLTKSISCTNAPETCDNDCYGIYVKGFPSLLNYDADSGADDARRAASGCGVEPSVCGASGDDRFNMDCGPDCQCDEFPPSSVTQGGEASILRCVPGPDNQSEGGQLGAFYKAPVDKGGCGSMPCEFQILFTDTGGSPYCINKGGDNDGKEFLYNPEGQGASRFVPDRRRSRVSTAMSNKNGTYEVHVPNPKDYVPASERREFLLDNGKRALFISRDKEQKLEGTLVSTENGTARVVKEFFGEEKSPWFRPGRY